MSAACLTLQWTTAWFSWCSRNRCVGRLCTFSFSLSSLCVPLSASLPLSLSHCVAVRCFPPPPPQLARAADPLVWFVDAQ